MSSLNILQNYEFLYDAIKKIYKQVIHWKNTSNILQKSWFGGEIVA